MLAGPVVALTSGASRPPGERPGLGQRLGTGSQEDTQVSLSQYKGKYVVLEWFNPQCPFVKKHYGGGNMQNLQKEFTDKGVVWLTIDSNAPGTEGNLTPEEAQKVATSWKTHETALLLDPEGNAGIINLVLNQEAEMGLSGGVNVGTSTTGMVNVNGKQAAPLYNYLRSHTDDHSDVHWNFSMPGVW